VDRCPPLVHRRLTPAGRCPALVSHFFTPTGRCPLLVGCYLPSVEPCPALVGRCPCSSSHHQPAPTAPARRCSPRPHRSLLWLRLPVQRRPPHLCPSSSASPTPSIARILSRPHSRCLKRPRIRLAGLWCFISTLYGLWYFTSTLYGLFLNTKPS
jgi:hypothetical protein